jgi:hypothetical protein
MEDVNMFTKVQTPTMFLQPGFEFADGVDEGDFAQEEGGFLQNEPLFAMPSQREPQEFHHSGLLASRSQDTMRVFLGPDGRAHVGDVRNPRDALRLSSVGVGSSEERAHEDDAVEALRRSGDVFALSFSDRHVVEMKMNALTSIIPPYHHEDAFRVLASYQRTCSQFYLQQQKGNIAKSEIVSMRLFEQNSARELAKLMGDGREISYLDAMDVFEKRGLAFAILSSHRDSSENRLVWSIHLHPDGVLCTPLGCVIQSPYVLHNVLQDLDSWEIPKRYEFVLARLLQNPLLTDASFQPEPQKEGGARIGIPIEFVDSESLQLIGRFDADIREVHGQERVVRKFSGDERYFLKRIYSENPFHAGSYLGESVFVHLGFSTIQSQADLVLEKLHRGDFEDIEEWFACMSEFNWLRAMNASFVGSCSKQNIDLSFFENDEDALAFQRSWYNFALERRTKYDRQWNQWLNIYERYCRQTPRMRELSTALPLASLVEDVDLEEVVAGGLRDLDAKGRNPQVERILYAKLLWLDQILPGLSRTPQLVELVREIVHDQINPDPKNRYGHNQFGNGRMLRVRKQRMTVQSILSQHASLQDETIADIVQYGRYDQETNTFVVPFRVSGETGRHPWQVDSLTCRNILRLKNPQVRVQWISASEEVLGEFSLDASGKFVLNGDFAAGVNEVFEQYKKEDFIKDEWNAKLFEDVLLRGYVLAMQGHLAALQEVQTPSELRKCTDIFERNVEKFEIFLKSYCAKADRRDVNPQLAEVSPWRLWQEHPLVKVQLELRSAFFDAQKRARTRLASHLRQAREDSLLDLRFLEPDSADQAVYTPQLHKFSHGLNQCLRKVA